jgi:photosystem I subunit V
MMCLSSQEATFALKTNDPAGFNIVDVLAWGALGHAAGYFFLAANSLTNSGFDPKPF